MKRARLKPIVGNWAGGESFYDREDEVADLLRLIREGASVSLNAPRRAGKTSLLREVARRLEADFTCVFVDLEAADSPEEAIAEIAGVAAAHQKVGSWARGWAEKLLGGAQVDLQLVRTDLREALRIDWQTRGDRLIGELSQDRPLALFLDELPVLIATLLARPSDATVRSPADLFLAWLRRLIQAHPHKLRIVLTGSIGLAPLVARAGLSTSLNVYQMMTLEPWSEATTTGALHALAQYTGAKLDEGAALQVHRLLGVGVPYHVQLVFQALEEDRKRRREPGISKADVDRVWRDRVLARPQSDLPHWEQRLRKALVPEEYRLAVELLTEASLAEPLTADKAYALASTFEEPADPLRAVLATLEHDGYLARGADGWYFPNRLVRAWWADKYGPLHRGGRS